MVLDFSQKKYKKLLEAIASSNYKVIRIRDHIEKSTIPEKTIILRHDVDLDAHYQLQFAELEKEFNIQSSYYFRTVGGVFDEKVITQVKKLGHEVGYHYEVFTKAKGDEKKAVKIFRKEQAVFFEKWGSLTVCPHGGSFVSDANGYSLQNILGLIPKLFAGKKVFSTHINFDLWENNEFDELGVIGDAYSSFDFADILYLSDTGRSWQEKYKRLDKVDSTVNPKFNIRSTDDIIRVIKNNEANKIYILVHFEQWKNNLFDWATWYAAQIIRRTGKRLLLK